MQETLVQFLGHEDILGKGIGHPLQYSWASLVAQTVKNPPAMRETWVRSLGWKILWRREPLPTPVFLPGEFHGQKNLAGSSPWGCRVGYDWRTFAFIWPSCWKALVGSPMLEGCFDQCWWRHDLIFGKPALWPLGATEQSLHPSIEMVWDHASVLSLSLK